MTFGHRGVKLVDCKRGRSWGGAIRKSDNFKSGLGRYHTMATWKLPPQKPGESK